MKTHNADNERLKRRYFRFLKEAKRYSESSVDSVAQALHRFERSNLFRDFRAFHIEQAVAFKNRLAAERAERTGQPLSKATLYSTLGHLRGFFQWLAGQPGFRSRMTYSDADYFSLSEKETRIAKAVREQPAPTLEQVHAALAALPATDDVEMRNRALLALVLLTGARDGAVASLKLKHVDVEERKLIQDAREVHTKFSKTFTTWFFPVGGQAELIVREWVHHLKQSLLFGPDDPLFPATRIIVGDQQQFAVAGLRREHWSNAGPIRRIFRECFARAALPYFGPHTLRRTLVQLGQRACPDPEAFKAWSQNLGHDKVLTTFTNYGAVAQHRQAEIILNLRPAARDVDRTDALASVIAQAIRNSPTVAGQMNKRATPV